MRAPPPRATGLSAAEGPPPVQVRHRVDDTTVEHLGVILSDDPNGVPVVAGKLATFLRTTGRDGHEGDRGFYLAA